nr:immunoglobulin heavy chain junction region [Macaca mulatta]
CARSYFSSRYNGYSWQLYYFDYW